MVVIIIAEGFPGGSAVKNLPVVQEPQEPWVGSLSQEDPLEEGTATHSSIPAWRIPWTEEPGELQSTGLQRVRHNWSDLACMQRCMAAPSKVGVLFGSVSNKLKKKKKKAFMTQLEIKTNIWWWYGMTVHFSPVLKGVFFLLLSSYHLEIHTEMFTDEIIWCLRLVSYIIWRSERVEYGLKEDRLGGDHCWSCLIGDGHRASLCFFVPRETFS